MIGSAVDLNMMQKAAMNATNNTESRFILKENHEFTP